MGIVDENPRRLLRPNALSHTGRIVRHEKQTVSIRREFFHDERLPTAGNARHDGILLKSKEPFVVVRSTYHRRGKAWACRVRNHRQRFRVSNDPEQISTPSRTRVETVRNVCPNMMTDQRKVARPSVISESSDPSWREVLRSCQHDLASQTSFYHIPVETIPKVPPNIRRSCCNKRIWFSFEIYYCTVHACILTARYCHQAGIHFTKEIAYALLKQISI